MRDVLENRVAKLEIDSFDTNITHFWLSLTEFYRWKAKNNIPQKPLEFNFGEQPGLSHANASINFFYRCVTNHTNLVA